MLDNKYYERPLPLAQSEECEPFEIAAKIFFDTDDPLLRGAVQYFTRDFKKLRGVAVNATPDSMAAGIVLSRVEHGVIALDAPSVHAACAAENYRIRVSEGALVCEFCGVKGANHALATVLQNATVKDGKIFWKYSLITDGPSCDYRAVMIDLGRNFHPIEYLYEYVDECFAYKLNYLHLHFTDTQLYTLPSKVYPKLSSVGKSYTFDEIKKLNSYALRRGVTIMPEVDLPGHCRAFQAAAPETFGDNGIINLTSEALAGVCEVLREVCGMFPYSDLFHIGGDEAELNKWTEHKESMDYFRMIDPEAAEAYEKAAHGDAGEYFVTLEEGAKAPEKQAEDETRRTLTERMLAHFISVCAQTVKDEGKRAVVWEGFNKCVNDRVPHDMLVMSWENYYQSTYELLDAGFDIINSSWKPTYVVTPNSMWSPSYIRDKWDIFTWEAIHPASPFLGKVIRVDENKWRKKIHGAQINAWGDHLARESEINLHTALEAEKYCVTARVASLAAKVWTGIAISSK